MNIGLVIISFVFFIAYNVYALIQCGEIPHSISQTYYRVGWKNGMGTTYQLMILSILPVIIGLDTQWWIKLCGLMSMFCLWGVTGAPDYWDDKQQTIHGIFTYTCEGCAGVYCIFITGMWWVMIAYFALFLGICFILKQWKDCRSYWIELACFFSFYTLTLLKIIL